MQERTSARRRAGVEAAAENCDEAAQPPIEISVDSWG